MERDREGDCEREWERKKADVFLRGLEDWNTMVQENKGEETVFRK